MNFHTVIRLVRFNFYFLKFECIRTKCFEYSNTGVRLHIDVNSKILRGCRAARRESSHPFDFALVYIDGPSNGHPGHPSSLESPFTSSLVYIPSSFFFHRQPDVQQPSTTPFHNGICPRPHCTILRPQFFGIFHVILKPRDETDKFGAVVKM